MIGISITKNSLGFIKSHKKTNLINCEEYGLIPTKSYNVNSSNIREILGRKKIRQSNYPSKSCMVFIDSSNVFMDLINCPLEVDIELFINWYNDVIFGEHFPVNLSQYNFEINDKSYLSINIEKQKQYELFSIASENNLKVKSVSIGIFSANQLANSTFDADISKGYLIWSVGKNEDEILVFKDGTFQCLFTMLRKNNKLSVRRVLGNSKFCEEIVENLQKKMLDDLKSFNIVDKIFMYRKTIDSDINKIYSKKNKDHIIILNPLSKVENFKLKKNKIIDSSFLANMGSIFSI